MKNKVIAIVLAGGKGKRMGASVSKQYLLIEDKPVLYYSLKAFEASNVDEIVIVAEKGTTEFCRTNIVEKFNIRKVSSIIEGGAERYNSVHNGLKAIADADKESYVLIHDGARALISVEVINKTIEEVKHKKAVVVGVPVKDTIKVVDENGLVVDTPKRELLWQIQTPQAFLYEEILAAYNKVISDNVQGITDDSMVMEYSNIRKVNVIMGEYENIKITTPDDLIYATNTIKKM
ncbi:MAG: 2-C-methyl-D-erythritol 4-phosphate cytidylyltransferase [Lachnospiraceae bacterium]|nr:2-C-methyl-D-erythritol 4-phosphate cytidylyltransferase [Lachnospiraceae bacterium]